MPEVGSKRGGWRTVLEAITSRKALAAAVAVGVVSMVLLTAVLPEQPAATRALVAWDLAVVVFIAGVTLRMQDLSPDELAARAEEQDEGRQTILGLCLVAAAVSVAAIGLQLRAAKMLHGVAKGWHVLFAFLTVGLSWLFVHMVFAVHYAHDYYTPDSGGTREGLRFPGDEPPDWWDFVHFAVVIGVAAQTADIAITSKPLRRVVTLHGVVAFVFNTVLLALTINLAAALVF